MIMDPEYPKPHILIIDDSPVNIKILVSLLMDEFEISVATSGEEGIEIIYSDNCFDLILLDITMPGMDGYEVCRNLKSKDSTRNIPVIFITARNEVEEETKGFELGAVDYITKPFSPAIVKARIHTHLDLKRHRDNLVKVNELLKNEIAERKKTEDVLRHLLKKQEINIDLAKNLLAFVNKPSPRYIKLSDNFTMFIDVISVPCFAEGGDHYFVQTLEHENTHKTIISLKDQSGHEVGCVLRSIITDMIHHARIAENGTSLLETVISDVNTHICNSKLFDRDDFFTGITAEIDHRTLMIRYVSAGHPPMILIRNQTITFLPEPGEAGSNMPIGVLNSISYISGECQLLPGDKIIFYTDGLIEIPLRNMKSTLSLDDLKQHVEWIIQRTPNIHASDLIDKLVTVIADISGEHVNRNKQNTSSDDVTIIGIEIESVTAFSKVVWMPKTIDELCQLIDELFTRIQNQGRNIGFDTPEMPLRIVLEEAALNAWIHGNRKNPEKTITIQWRFGNDFHIEIIDQGEGYDVNSIPDPTIDTNITKQNGRGIFIIKHFADDIAWEKNGRHLMIRFNNRRLTADSPQMTKI